MSIAEATDGLMALDSPPPDQKEGPESVGALRRAIHLLINCIEAGATSPESQPDDGTLAEACDLLTDAAMRVSFEILRRKEITQ